jgi:hypothetical protein
MSTKTFTGESQELHLLAEDVKMWFQGSGYEVQAASNDGIHIIQARKTSGVRTFFGTNQAFNVKIEGQPTCYVVEVGTGKWVENLAGSGISGLFTGGLTWLTGAAGAAWVKKVESDLWNWLDLRNVKAQSTPAPAPVATPAPTPAPAVASAPAPIANIPEQIKKLADLRDMGVLTPEEFDAKKKELLSRM